MARRAQGVRATQGDLQPFHPLEPTEVFNRILAELAAKAGEPDTIMIDATHLKAHRTAASPLKGGLFPDLLGASRAA